MYQTDKEKKNKQMGAIISVGAHIAVFLLFLFMVAWRAPDPPLPEIGIELNFGLDDAGTGDEQPEPFTTPADTDSNEEATLGGMEEEVEDQVPVEEMAEPISAPTEATEVPTEEVVNEVTNTQESPDVVKKTPAPETKKEEVKEPKEKKEETPKLPPVLYPNNKTGAGGKGGKSNTAQNANQGDQANAVGDQGDKDGTVDSRALYGNAGGGGGSSLQMSGWMWDSKPQPKDTSSESGKLVFQVVIDDKGNIIRVKTIESGVSPTVEKIYRDEVMKLTFSKTAGTSVASTSTGTITFVIKAR
ncbi:MAG: hypothetical protein L3J06_03275 [Cyclobacteriaceae bacterium]|nr:hypothetical protein [Cyclobacteriaceae bacterium]